MKIFKLSFAAIIGIAALGLTLASYAGAFNKALVKAQVEAGCYRTVTVDCQPPATAPDGLYQNAGITNPGVGQSTTNPSYGISGPSGATTLGAILSSGCTVTAGTLFLDDPAAQCEPEFTPFCCFNVDANSRVTAVFFGDHPNT